MPQAFATSTELDALQLKLISDELRVRFTWKSAKEIAA